MGFITPWEKFPAMILRKRLGRPVYCGWAWCGWSECGEEGENLGVYQQRYRRLDFWTSGYTPKGKKQNFFMRPTWPENPQSEAQIIQREKMSSAISAWWALTDEQKAWYRNYANRISRKGYNYFISQYLKSH